MKILHAPVNIAGQLTEISRAQRLLGYQSNVLVFDQEYLNYEADINLNLKKTDSVFNRVYRIVRNFIECLLTYDVFHFHGGRSLLPYGWDLPIYRLFGKKVFMQYWGSDCFQYDIAHQYALFTEKEMAAIFHPQKDENVRSRIKVVQSLVNATIVGDPALSPFVPKSKIVLKGVNLEKLKFVGLKPKISHLNLVHAPSRKEVKGTDIILKTIERLRQEGYKFNFKLIEKQSNEKALEFYRKSDVIIDDVLQGPYGILCMEAMALGKPVLCRIDPKLKKFYHNLPVVDSNPDNLYQNLRKILGNKKLREKLSRQGRIYMETNHDILKSAKKFIKLYKNA